MTSGVYSLFIVSLQNSTVFTDEDKYVYKQIVISKDEQNMRNLAGKLIKAYLLYTYKKRLEIYESRKI